MKTVVLNFTQPSNKEVLVLLAPDDMDVQAEIAECRTRRSRSSFSRENRPQTVFYWLIDRGCRTPDEPPVMIDGWHEPPMTRPRSENCNVPLVEPYIRIGEIPDTSDYDDWIPVSDTPDTYADAFARAENQPIGSHPSAPTQEERDTAIGRSMRIETVPNSLYQTVRPGRPIEWRPYARNMEITAQPSDRLYESPGSDTPQSVRFANPVSWEWGEASISLDAMRELERRASGISETLAASLAHPPTTRDQDQQ